MSAPARPGARAEHRSRVEWVDTDAAGIYHNSTVIRFVESAEASLMARLGLPGYFPAAPRVHYEVDFEAPLVFGQGVTTHLRVEDVGRTSMTFGFEVWGDTADGGPPVRAARGRYVTVHLERDAEGGRHAAPWPPTWVAALGAPGGPPQ